MKKSILFALLLLLGKGAIAQNGTVTIDNQTSSTVDVYLFGYDPIVVPGSSCNSFISKKISVSGNTISAFDPCVVQGTVGWMNFGPGATFYPCPMAMPPTIIWTDAKVIGSCLGAGVMLTDASYGCNGGPTSATDPCGMNSSWVRSNISGPGDDVLLTIW